MEGLLLIGVAENLLVKLSSKVYQEISSIYGVRTDVEELMITISSIKAVLFDAEIKKTHNKKVSIWLEQLKDLLYDAEDVFDEFECQTLHEKLMNQRRTNKKVLYFFPLHFINSSIFNFKMARGIKAIRKRLDEIDSRRKKFRLIENGVEYFPHAIRETHSFIHESEASLVVGRDNDKHRTVQLLIHSNVDKQLSVVSLVGMGGLGKTTLAKLVYNDQRIKKYFEKKMWICVSMDFDVRRLTREILSSATGSQVSESLTLDQLQIQLRESLAGRRFLLVLDDVWNENANDWGDLRQFLMDGAKGSKILVTTRMDSIANIMSSDGKHELRGLSKEDSWSLFAKYALNDGKEKTIPDNLKRIGDAILDKCKGVPLAIRSLGSLLYSKCTVREWEYIRDCEIWKLADQKGDGILPALELSYSLMPSYLKPCFVYCTLFPKDYVYSYNRLIRLWMAQGMLHSENESEELEDIGERYFRELLSRSFFQDFQTHGFDLQFKLHDLVHDLGLSVAHGRYLTIESDTKNISENAQHVYISNFMFDTWSCPQRLKRVRSVAFADNWGICYYVDKSIMRFKFLRVLELEGSCMSLPDSIGTLKHLRYIGLRENYWLKSLPISICELLSLQTMILGGCKQLEAIPRGVRNMISLRCLWINEKQMSWILQEVGIECLCNLRFLEITGCSSLSEELENNEDVSNQIVMQPKLQTLHLRRLSWVALPGWIRSFAKTLRQLRIVACDELLTLPEWLSELSSLEILEIVACWDLSSLPQGMKNLTSLTKLIIKDCGGLSLRERRDQWHEIAHVPEVVIDFESMDGMESS